MQIFRSIDSNSVKGFPKDPKEAFCKVKKIFTDNFLFTVAFLEGVFGLVINELF